MVTPPKERQTSCSWKGHKTNLPELKSVARMCKMETNSKHGRRILTWSQYLLLVNNFLELIACTPLQVFWPAGTGCLYPLHFMHALQSSLTLSMYHFSQDHPIVASICYCKCYRKNPRKRSHILQTSASRTRTWPYFQWWARGHAETKGMS